MKCLSGFGNLPRSRLSLVTQRSSPQALRDETKNGCERDYETTMVSGVCLHSRRFCKATLFGKKQIKKTLFHNIQSIAQKQYQDYLKSDLKL